MKESGKWSRSVVSDSLRPHYQAPQSMELSRQEYWSGLPFPSPGDLPNPGIEPRDRTQVSRTQVSWTQVSWTQVSWTQVSRIACRRFTIWATGDSLVNGRAGIQILTSGCQAHESRYHINYLCTIVHLEWKLFLQQDVPTSIFRLFINESITELKLIN